MGNEQPRKPNKASKGQIEIACMKTKFHLEMMKNRTDAKTMAVEKELVTKIRSKNRNKVEEILLAESIVNGLKYAQGSLCIT